RPRTAPGAPRSTSSTRSSPTGSKTGAVSSRTDGGLTAALFLFRRGDSGRGHRYKLHVRSADRCTPPTVILRLPTLSDSGIPPFSGRRASSKIISREDTHGGRGPLSSVWKIKEMTDELVHAKRSCRCLCAAGPPGAHG